MAIRKTWPLLCGTILSMSLTAAGLFLAMPAFAQDPITQQVLSKLVPSELPSLITTRFHSEDRRRTDVTWYREVDGRFQNYFSGPVVMHGSNFCSSLLEGAQNFPLNKMVSTEYISTAQKEVLQKLGDRLDHSQFRFYEMTRPLDLNQPQEIDVTRGDLPLATLPLLTGGKVVGVEATLWTVGAQITHSHVRKQIAKMPWQLDEAYRDIHVDRDKYPLAWELGRAAQNSPRNFHRLVGVAALEMLYEVMAYTEDLDNAYVFAHALGPMQKRVFLMPKIPGTSESIFKVFHEANAETGDVVLVAKLKDILAFLPPENTSKRIHDAMEVAAGELTAEGVTEHIFALRNNIQQSLDVARPTFGDRRFPIIIRDLTQFPGWMMAKVSEKHGVYDSAGPLLARHFSGYIQDYTNTGGHITDPKFVPAAALASAKPVAISNLHGESAKADEQYTLKTLIAAYLYYAGKLRQNYPEHAEALLDLIPFIITSAEPEVVEQASRIPGRIPGRVEFPDVSAKIETAPDGLSMQPKLAFESQPVHVFDHQTIKNLLREHPRLVIEAEGALKLGNFQIMQHKMESLF